MEDKMQVFEEIKRRIQFACEQKDHDSLTLNDLGFIKEDVNDGRLIHYLYKPGNESSLEIEIDFRCFDQSKAFQILPDMNRFTAQLKEGNTVIETFQDEYED